MNSYVTKLGTLPKKPSSSPQTRDLIMPNMAAAKINSPSVDRLHSVNMGFSARVDALQTL